MQSTMLLATVTLDLTSCVSELSHRVLFITMTFRPSDLFHFVDMIIMCSVSFPIFRFLLVMMFDTILLANL